MRQSRLLQINQEVADLGTKGFAGAIDDAIGKVGKLVKSLGSLDPEDSMTAQRYASVMSKVKKQLASIEKSASNGLTDAVKQKTSLANKLASKHLQLETGLKVSLSSAVDQSLGPRFAAKLVDDIKKQIKSSVFHQESVQQMIDRLGKLNLGKRYRSVADRIISSETNSVYNTSKISGLREINKIQANQHKKRFRKMWNAIIDGRTCAQCFSMHMEQAEVDERIAGRFSPPLHPRCRCCVVAVEQGENSPAL